MTCSADCYDLINCGYFYMEVLNKVSYIQFLFGLKVYRFSRLKYIFSLFSDKVCFAI